MKTKQLVTLALAGLTVTILAVSVCTHGYASGNDNVTVQETYLGKLEYQDQTITKKTAELLHRQILLQRATQLVSWAMPMMNFYQLYPAMLSNQKMSEDDVFFSLCDGYHPTISVILNDSMKLSKKNRSILSTLKFVE